jgi:hypothetical protein
MRWPVRTRRDEKREPLITDVVGIVVGTAGVFGILLKGFQPLDLITLLILTVATFRLVQGYRLGEPWLSKRPNARGKPR